MVRNEINFKWKKCQNLRQRDLAARRMQSLAKTGSFKRKEKFGGCDLRNLNKYQKCWRRGKERES